MLISQQLDIWDTPRNRWVPKCWIQLDINSPFLDVDLFLEWKHWYLTHTQTQMGVDTTDLDIPSQRKGFDHYPNTPRKPAEWRAPLVVTVLIDVFVNDGTGSSWHEDACFKAVLIVFKHYREWRRLLVGSIHRGDATTSWKPTRRLSRVVRSDTPYPCRTPEDRRAPELCLGGVPPSPTISWDLLEANVDIGALKFQGNNGPKSSSPLKLSSGIAIRVEDQKKSIKKTYFFLMRSIFLFDPPPTPGNPPIPPTKTWTLLQNIQHRYSKWLA